MFLACCTMRSRGRRRPRWSQVLVLILLGQYLACCVRAQESNPSKPEVQPLSGTEAPTVSSLAPLSKVVESNNLRAKGKAPFHLQLSFQLFDLNGKPRENGNLDDWWAADAGSHLEIETSSLGKLEDLTDPASASDEARRSIFLMRLLLDAIQDPASPLRAKGHLAFEDKIEGKVELTCMYVEPEASQQPASAFPHVCTERPTILFA